MQAAQKKEHQEWHTVKFGDLAKCISKRVDPTGTNLKVYVGLEHLDSDCLRIKRKGSPNDVKGQKLLVKPGQIIFGKRRAYQRKVAIADFEGICSAHAMVLEAMPNVIIPEFLPFFMQSNTFMERAVSISEGSLSPTIKWKTLSQQEFILPPISEQKRILMLLQKLEEVIVKNDRAGRTLQNLRRALEGDLFDFDGFVEVGEICEVKTGGTPSRAKPSYWGGEIKWMSSGEIHNKFISDTEEKITEEGLTKSNARLLPSETVFIAMNGQGKTRGTVAISKCELTCNQSLAALICNQEAILPMFLYFYLRTQYQNIRNLTGEGRNGLNLKLVRSIKVPSISIEKQQQAINLLSNLSEQGDLLKQKNRKLIAMKKAVLTSYLEGVA